MVDTTIGNLVGAGILLGVTKKVIKKPKKAYKSVSLNKLHEQMKKMQSRGFKPYLKGSRGRVRIVYE